MKPIFLFLLLLSTFVFAEPKDIEVQLEQPVLLNVGDTATISDFRITLLSVNDDGCGREIECYWIALRDATFQVWQGDEDLGEIILSKASREDSKPFVQLGKYYFVLEDAVGYETDTPTAEFYVSNIEPYLYQ